jgi:choline dehydrogenase-like flavoprotein
MATPEADYIMVGRGLTGCALASRLHQEDDSLDILIIEAGLGPSGNPNTTTPAGAFTLIGSDIDWAYPNVPPNTGDRVHILHAGKALGGGSVINYGGWIRGDASDYDEWARVVRDDRWSFKGLLPFFRRQSVILTLMRTLKYMGLTALCTLPLSQQVTLNESMDSVDLSGRLGAKSGSITILNHPRDHWLESPSSSKIGMMGNASQHI